MAQRRRPSRSSSGRSSSRRPPAGRAAARRTSTSRRTAPRGGPSRASPPPRNNTPAIIAGVVIVGALLLVIAVSMGKGEKKSERPRAKVQYETSYEPEDASAGPSRLEAPKIPHSMKAKAERLVEQARPLAEKGEAAYKKSLEAKSAGDDDLWQEKLREASTYFQEINDLYNDLILEIDASYTNDDWDAEQVANHYMGREASIISRYLRRFQDIRKQRRR